MFQDLLVSKVRSAWLSIFLNQLYINHSFIAIKPNDNNNLAGNINESPGLLRHKPSIYDSNKEPACNINHEQI